MFYSSASHCKPMHCHCNNCRCDFEADVLSNRCPECGSLDVRDATRDEWKEHLKRLGMEEPICEEKALYWTWAVR